jgi:hypothetical protein
MAKQSPLAYLPEVSGQERPDTNVQTEEALNTLLEALERRREKPMFDPVGLATAGGFMKPTKTGSGFEALGNAIEAYSGARQGGVRLRFAFQMPRPMRHPDLRVKWA